MAQNIFPSGSTINPANTLRHDIKKCLTSTFDWFEKVRGRVRGLA